MISFFRVVTPLLLNYDGITIEYLHLHLHLYPLPPFPSYINFLETLANP